MSFDENTQTMSVGSQDWLEASKGMQIRSYLSPMGNVEITGESVEHNPQDEPNPHHREDFDRLLEGGARSSE
jgi:hypothetical protein